jgi:hypothetical protein
LRSSIREYGSSDSLERAALYHELSWTSHRGRFGFPRFTTLAS